MNWITCVYLRVLPKLPSQLYSLFGKLIEKGNGRYTEVKIRRIIYGLEKPLVKTTQGHCKKSPKETLKNPKNCINNLGPL